MSVSHGFHTTRPRESRRTIAWATDRANYDYGGTLPALHCHKNTNKVCQERNQQLYVNISQINTNKQTMVVKYLGLSATNGDRLLALPRTLRVRALICNTCRDVIATSCIRTQRFGINAFHCPTYAVFHSAPCYFMCHNNMTALHV